MQQEMKKKLEQDRKHIESEVERSKKEMQNFKLNKLVLILNSTVIKHTRAMKNQAFNIIH